MLTDSKFGFKGSDVRTQIDDHIWRIDEVLLGHGLVWVCRYDGDCSQIYQLVELSTVN